MRRVLYSDTSFPREGRTYCDTSFILDLWTHDRVVVRGQGTVSPTVRTRVVQASSYFHAAKAAGVQFCTSVFAWEEAYHVLLNVPLNKAVRAAGATNWKALRASDSAAFDRALALGRAALESFAAFYDTLQIDPLFFGRLPDGRFVLETGVTADARLLLQLYELDAMDAFHFATLKRFDIPTAVSSDSDWLAIRSPRVLVTSA